MPSRASNKERGHGREKESVRCLPSSIGRPTRSNPANQLPQHQASQGERQTHASSVFRKTHKINSIDSPNLGFFHFEQTRPTATQPRFGSRIANRPSAEKSQKRSTHTGFSGTSRTIATSPDIRLCGHVSTRGRPFRRSSFFSTQAIRQENLAV